jgi:hypothetical protein
MHRVAWARVHEAVHIYGEAHVGARAQARLFWTRLYHPFSEHFSLKNIIATQNIMTSNHDLIRNKRHRCSSLLPLPCNFFPTAQERLLGQGLLIIEAS